MKKVKVLFIILFIVLLIGTASLAVIYFATDTFKTDKELFYKYAGQIQIKDVLDVEAYNNYMKRTYIEKHSNDGELSIEVKQKTNTLKESIKYVR